MNELLKTEHLSVSFFTDAGEVEAVRDVSFTVRKGEVLAIVGESGCGKSALCKSIMKLLPKTAKIKYLWYFVYCSYRRNVFYRMCIQK